jgi:hypothetical protein
MKTLAFLLAMTGSVLACAPAPSCWLKLSPEYVRSVCLGYAKDGQTLKQIAQFLDEPEKIGEFAKACKKFHVNLKDE